MGVTAWAKSESVCGGGRCHDAVGHHACTVSVLAEMDTVGKKSGWRAILSLQRYVIRT